MELLSFSGLGSCPCRAAAPETSAARTWRNGEIRPCEQDRNLKGLIASSSSWKNDCGIAQARRGFRREGARETRVRREVEFVFRAARIRAAARVDCSAGECRFTGIHRKSRIVEGPQKHRVGCQFFRATLAAELREGKTALHSSKDGDYEDASGLSLPPALDEVLEYVKLDNEIQQGFTKQGKFLDDGDSDGEVGVQDGYVGLFVRLLGLDNAAEDREEAVRALWRHSAGGKDFVDEIVAFSGCLNLIVSLLLSDRPASAVAAAGLLRNISAVDVYRSSVAQAGAVQEVVGLLTRRSVSCEVKDEAMKVLWNLSVDEGPRKVLAQQDVLQFLLKNLGSEIVSERESAAGIIANLTVGALHHDALVAVGAVPTMAAILLDDREESKVVRQEVRDALLKLGLDEKIKGLLIEEGLVLVPAIGASAYRSFKPLLQVTQPLPDDVKVRPPATKVESKFGAGELLLGLNVENAVIDDSTRLTIEGRVRQQFLARIGVLGKKPAKSDTGGDDKFTLLPWWDGIPRLILILGLDDLVVARQAALVIAEIAVNETNRNALQKGGSIPHLVRLLGCGDEDATEAAALALDKLAIDQQIRMSINAHDAPSALVALLKAENAPDRVKAKAVCALSRLSQLGEDLEALGNGQLTLSAEVGVAIPALLDLVQSEKLDNEAKEEAEEILEEMSNLKADSRDKIISTGGLPPLIGYMQKGSPKEAKEATCVLENIITSANVGKIMDADVQSALASLLSITFQEVSAELSSGKAISRQDGYMLVSEASRVLEKLARFAQVDTALYTPLLIKLLVADIPLGTKDWISACLFRLDQLNDRNSDQGRGPGSEESASETIPWLVKEMGEDFSHTVRERAVIHLRQVVSQGKSACATSIVEVEGVPSLANMLKHGQSVGRGAAVAILYNLSMIEGNHSKILQAGVVPSLIELVQNRIPEWKMALYLLRLLHS